MAEVIPLSASTSVPIDDEQRYRQQVERIYNRISLTGLPERDPRLNELPLDQIFITLAVEASQPPSLPDDREMAEGADKLPKDHRSDSGTRLRPPPEPQKLSVGEALRRFRRLVVVGAPGSGKTTLLRWLAVTFAANRQAQPDLLGSAFTEPYLPVLLDLRRFADRFRKLSEQPETFNLAAEASIYIAQDARFAKTPAPVIRDAITAGRCLILLDGLDEIVDQATRRRVVEAIEALYLDSTQKSAGNLCMLTTRPYGFAGLSLGGGFQTVTVRPFGREDVSAFIRNWYRVAYGTDALAEEAAELVETVRKNDRVEALALNPLLCTIITIVYRNNRVLPDRRVELYFKCCEAFLDTWERNKDIKSSGLIGGLSWQMKLELLAGLAYWMHSEAERLEHHQFDTGQHFRLRQLQIMKEARAASEPEALDAVLSNLGLPLERLGLEACAMVAWRVESHRLAGDLHKDATGEGSRGVAKLLLIVRALGDATCEHEGRLANTPSPTTALGVVCRRRGHAAHIDGVERRNIDAELHGGRTK